MKIDYDADTDTLTIALREGEEIADSVEDPQGVILDYDGAGELVSIEILDASRHVGRSGAISLQRGT
jgi:YD repeat-containing protein